MMFSIAIKFAPMCLSGATDGLLVTDGYEMGQGFFVHLSSNALYLRNWHARAISPPYKQDLVLVLEAVDMLRH